MNSKLWYRSFGTNTDSHWPVNSSQTSLSICLRTSLVWKDYLLNKPWKSSTLYGASTVNTNRETQLIPSPLNPSLYMDAIRIGQQVLMEQGSKASAAMEIFKILKDESRDVVLQAFIEGAFKRSKWIEQRPHVKECWSQDWINYTLKLGQESLVPSCCFAAKHPGA